MLIQTELPPGSGFFKKITYPFIRSFFYFFFSLIPYYPIRRFNKPELKGPYLWACSHSNFLCDVIPAGAEGPCPTKFLGKSTLFKFPIKGFIEFCGALPVARAEDMKNRPPEARSAQNRSTFKAAIAAMKQGWPIAIFPEGMSIVSPGLVLPLKPGVAKLAFAAEEANDFNLGVKIIPVGLDYGSRTRVASGLDIRYGTPIPIAEYRELYRENDDEAVKAVMQRLTNELKLIFPHFKDEHTLSLGKKIVALGLAPNRHSIAQLFLQREDDAAFWSGLHERMHDFDASVKDHGIPVAAWGHRKKWKEIGSSGRIIRSVFVFFGLPLAFLDLFNNSVPELCVQSVVDYLAVDETEKMTLRFMISPVILGIVYAFQFLFLKKMVFELAMLNAGYSWYFLYALSSFVLWYGGVHWRRQLNRIASLFFFWRAGVHGRSEVVDRYRSLRQHLGNM